MTNLIMMKGIAHVRELVAWISRSRKLPSPKATDPKERSLAHRLHNLRAAHEGRHPRMKFLPQYDQIAIMADMPHLFDRQR